MLCYIILYYVRRAAGGRRAGARPRPGAGSLLWSGQNRFSPEITKVKLRWKMPLKIHWNFPVKIRWESDNPAENTAEQLQFVGKCH